MTVQLIPTFNEPSSVQHTTLEGTTFGLQFDFNQRCACWYLSIADTDGVDIYNGVKLICGFPLLRKCADPRRPPGELYVLSATPDLTPPGRGELDQDTGRCSLLYITSDWLALLRTPGGLAAILAQLAANTQSSSSSTYGTR
jgi:hypothetical protein